MLLNDTSLMHRSTASAGKLVIRKLPTHFAQPVVTAWLPEPVRGEQYVLGPMTHDQTVSLAVSPADSALVAGNMYIHHVKIPIQSYSHTNTNTKTKQNKKLWNIIHDQNNLV